MLPCEAGKKEAGIYQAEPEKSTSKVRNLEAYMEKEGDGIYSAEPADDCSMVK